MHVESHITAVSCNKKVINMHSLQRLNKKLCAMRGERMMRQNKIVRICQEIQSFLGKYCNNELYCLGTKCHNCSRLAGIYVCMWLCTYHMYIRTYACMYTRKIMDEQKLVLLYIR